MKKIVIISDLHLGDRSGSDDFKGHEQLKHLLDYVKLEKAELILLGDIFELWQADLDKILFSYSDIMAKLFDLAALTNVYYVVGNHDYLPFYKYIGKRFGNISVLAEYRNEEIGLLAHHGHKYDQFNDVDFAIRNIKEPLGKRVSWAVGLLEKYLDPDIDNKLGKLSKKLGSLIHDYKGELEEVAKEYVKKEMKDKGQFYREVIELRRNSSPGLFNFDEAFIGNYEKRAMAEFNDIIRTVVIGHTHVPKCVPSGDNLYVNSGSWAYTEYPCNFVEICKGQARLKKAEELV